MILDLGVNKLNHLWHLIVFSFFHKLVLKVIIWVTHLSAWESHCCTLVGTQAPYIFYFLFFCLDFFSFFKSWKKLYFYIYKKIGFPISTPSEKYFVRALEKILVSIFILSTKTPTQELLKEIFTFWGGKAKGHRFEALGLDIVSWGDPLMGIRDCYIIDMIWWKSIDVG